MSDPIDVDNEGNPLTLMDVISMDDTVSDEIDLKIRVERLYELLGRMEASREKEILVLRYGLYGNDYHTQRQVAKRLGISRSYVSIRRYCKYMGFILLLFQLRKTEEKLDILGFRKFDALHQANQQFAVVLCRG